MHRRSIAWLIAGMSGCLAALACASGARAQTWPTDAAWRVLACGDVPSFDPLRDEPAARNERDVVGDAASPALYFAADPTHFFFRMRIDADPTVGTEMGPFGWALELDTDGAPATYELFGAVDGIAEEVVLGANATQVRLNDPADPVDTILTRYAVPTHARAVLAAAPFASSFGGDPDFFIDWALDRADLAARGVTDASELVAVMGTSSTARAIDADLACSDGSGSDPRTLTWAATGPFRPDATVIVDVDGDGLSDATEVRIGTNPAVADTDGDGFSDGVEVRAGSDPNDRDSRPATGPLGVRGGPGGCAASGASGAGAGSWLALLAALALTRRRAHLV